MTQIFSYSVDEPFETPRFINAAVCLTSSSDTKHAETFLMKQLLR
jgi:hypothetical protein